MADPVRCVEDTVHHYFQPVHWSAVTGVPITYVLNERDRPVPPETQEEMAARLPAAGDGHPGRLGPPVPGDVTGDLRRGRRQVVAGVVADPPPGRPVPGVTSPARQSPQERHPVARSRTTSPSTFPLVVRPSQGRGAGANGSASKADTSSGDIGPPGRQRRDAVGRQLVPVAGLGGHQIALGLHVQGDEVGDPVPQRAPYGLGGRRGMRLVTDPRHQVADVVHEPGRRQLVVIGGVTLENAAVCNAWSNCETDEP